MPCNDVFSSHLSQMPLKIGSVSTHRFCLSYVCDKNPLQKDNIHTLHFHDPVRVSVVGICAPWGKYMVCIMCMHCRSKRHPKMKGLHATSVLFLGQTIIFLYLQEPSHIATDMRNITLGKGRIWGHVFIGPCRKPMAKNTIIIKKKFWTSKFPSSLPLTHPAHLLHPQTITYFLLIFFHLVVFSVKQQVK